MRRSITASLRRGALALSLIGLVPGAAQAGLVTGSWDPVFGSFLPGLSWAVQGVFYVPDSCSNQIDGDYLTTGLCAGVTVNNAKLRLYDTALADPNNFLQINANSTHIDFHTEPVSPGYGVKRVRVTSGQVVGFDAGRQDGSFLAADLFLTPVYGWYSPPPSAANNLFGMVFRLDGPEIECYKCDAVVGYPTGSNNNNPSVFAVKTQLEQFLITYTDSGDPKQSDANGNPIGARLDGAGVFLGLSTADGTVPEPGTLGLALAALAACGLLRRRHG